VGDNCIKVDAHDMRCTSAFGAQRVFLDYTAGTASDALDVPVASAPFTLDAKMGPGPDYLTSYGPVAINASMGLGDDYVDLSATGDTALTPAGGAIDGGDGDDSLYIADGHHETPSCGAGVWDYLLSDPGENNADCEFVDHTTPQY
jgi:hypothetical protein